MIEVKEFLDGSADIKLLAALNQAKINGFKRLRCTFQSSLEKSKQGKKVFDKSIMGTV